MNNFFTVLSFLLATPALVAQSTNHPLRVYQNEAISSPVQRSFSVDEWVKSTGEFSQGDSLVLLHKTNSKTQTHFTYQKYHNGYAIYMGVIKVSISHAGKIMQYHNNTIKSKQTTYTSSSFKTQLPSTATNIENVWISQNGNYFLGLKYHTSENGLTYETALLDADYAFTELLTPQYSHTEIDTQGVGYVFLPNPITSANTTYGSLYVDNDDQTNAALDAERVEKQLQVSFNNNEFHLENDFVKIVDFDPPAVPVATSPDGEFYYDRSLTGFEDVNALYHISTQKQFLEQLGFDSLMNYQIHVDAHGFGGLDQSAFFPFNNPPAISFGEGGVDDAEDADVIIHEYGHAIMHSASPNSSGGSERNAIDEAVGDYFAGSYSRSINPHDYEKIFNWDGHNEFWNGRVLFNNKMYPDDLQNNLYLDAPMFSGSVMALELITSKAVAHTILLEASHSIYSYITMPEMAQLMLDADTLLYGGQYYRHICYSFLDRGILSSCEGERPVGIKKISNNSISRLYNSQQFANGHGALTVKTNGPSQINLYSLDGRLITNIKFKDELVIQPTLVTTGTYIMIIEVNNTSEHHLIQRY